MIKMIIRNRFPISLKRLGCKIIILMLMGHLLKLVLLHMIQLTLPSMNLEIFLKTPMRGLVVQMEIQFQEILCPERQMDLEIQWLKKGGHNQ